MSGIRRSLACGTAPGGWLSLAKHPPVPGLSLRQVGGRGNGQFNSSSAAHRSGRTPCGRPPVICRAPGDQPPQNAVAWCVAVDREICPQLDPAQRPRVAKVARQASVGVKPTPIGGPYSSVCKLPSPDASEPAGCQAQPGGRGAMMQFRQFRCQSLVHRAAETGRPSGWIAPWLPPAADRLPGSPARNASELQARAMGGLMGWIMWETENAWLLHCGDLRQ